MGIGPGQPNSAADVWAHEWQQLSWSAINQAMGHYLRGCANVVMARTPQQALTALHETQTVLLTHSVETFAEATRLWRKQSTKMRAHPRNPTVKPETIRLFERRRPR